MKGKMRQALRQELETENIERGLGQGWISGLSALLLSLLSLCLLLTLRFPQSLTLEELHKHIQGAWVIRAQQACLICAFVLACLSLILRQRKILGGTALAVVIFTTSFAVFGPRESEPTWTLNFALDWFLINLFISAFLFVPLEKTFRLRKQAVFRPDWQLDLLYFFISSMLVQFLTYVSMLPSNNLNSLLALSASKEFFSSLCFPLQLFAIMFLTDFVQYWFHRCFHEVSWLWKFHAVHHCAEKMDWLAGSRMHFLEIIFLRAITVIPMSLLGFDEAAIATYLVLLYLYSTYIHANLRFNIECLKPFIVTPRFHHWHHGLEKEAINVNYAIHFPWIDKMFGTYYMPKDKWPCGYGVHSGKPPASFWGQFMHPFRSKKK